MNEELIKKVCDFLYRDGGFASIARNGMYDLHEEEFRIAFEEYLKTGKNVLNEFDQLTWINWSLSDNRWGINKLSNVQVKFAKKSLKGKGFWNIKYYYTRDELLRLIELISNFEQEEKIKKTYKYLRTTGFTYDLRNKVIKRDGKCVKCGSIERLEVDHVKPLYKGGNNALKNLQTLCNKCHKVKTKEDRK